MADDEPSALVPRDQYEKALQRAEEADAARREAEAARRDAERRANFPAMAVAAGVPPELVADMDPDQSEDDVRRWVESFRDYCAEVTRKELENFRPDRRRGNMLVQTPATANQTLKLGPGAPDWLRERLEQNEVNFNGR